MGELNIISAKVRKLDLKEVPTDHPHCFELITPIAKVRSPTVFTACVPQQRHRDVRRSSHETLQYMIATESKRETDEWANMIEHMRLRIFESGDVEVQEPADERSKTPSRASRRQVNVKKKSNSTIRHTMRILGSLVQSLASFLFVAGSSL